MEKVSATIWIIGVAIVVHKVQLICFHINLPYTKSENRNAKKTLPGKV